MSSTVDLPESDGYIVSEELKWPATQTAGPSRPPRRTRRDLDSLTANESDKGLARHTDGGQKHWVFLSKAEVAELVDALDSKSSMAYPMWGFESPLRHTKIENGRLRIEDC